MLTVPDCQQISRLSDKDILARDDLRVVAIEPASAPPEIEFIDDPATTSRFDPPRVIFGTPAIEDCLHGVVTGETRKLPDRYVSALQDAECIGWDTLLSGSSIIGPTGPLNTNEDLEYFQKVTATGHAGWALRKHGNGWRAVCRKNRFKDTQEKTAFFISGLEPGNFGSFLLRHLPQLMLLKETAIPFDVLIVPSKTHWTMDIVKLLNIDVPIISTSEALGVQFSKIFYIANYYHEGTLRELDNVRIRRLIDEMKPLDAERPSRVYLSRRLQSHSRPHYRPLINEKILEEKCERDGYRIIFPEAMQLFDQMRILSSAENIIGPSGSGMMASMFARSGSKTLELESFTRNIRQHARLYSSKRHEYGFIFGDLSHDAKRPTIFQEWSIDETLFEAALDEFSKW